MSLTPKRKSLMDFGQLVPSRWAKGGSSKTTALTRWGTRPAAPRAAIHPLPTIGNAVQNQKWCTDSGSRSDIDALTTDGE